LTIDLDLAKAMGKNKKKNKEPEEGGWSFAQFFRSLFCGNKPKKAKKAKKHKVEEPPSLDETSSSSSTSASANTPTDIRSPMETAPDAPPSPPSNDKIVKDKEIADKAMINDKKMQEVKDSINNATAQQTQLHSGKPATPSKSPKKSETPKSRVGHVLSQRDKNRLNDRRQKLKLLKSKQKSATPKKSPNSVNSLKGGSTKPQSYMLPIGARGYAPDSTNRSNRFSLKYVPEDGEIVEEQMVTQLNFHIMFDKLSRLNYNLETIMRSYKGIVKSLIKLQVPRDKQKEQTKKWNSVVPGSEDSNTNDSKSVNEGVDETLTRLTVKQLLDPKTKREAMSDLQELVEELNLALDELHVYYDDENDVFDMDEYCRSEFRITMDQYQIVQRQLDKLNDLVEKLLESYSKELINMFELQ